MTLNIFCNKKKTKTKKKQLNFAIFVYQGRIIGLVSHWLLSSRFSLNFGKRMNCKDPEGTGFCFFCGCANSPFITSTVHGRVRSLIVQQVLLLPGVDVIGTSFIVLPTATIGSGETSQLPMMSGPIAWTAPLGMRNA